MLRDSYPVVFVNWSTAYVEIHEMNNKAHSTTYLTPDPRSVNPAVTVTIMFEYRNKSTGWKTIGRAISHG